MSQSSAPEQVEITEGKQDVDTSKYNAIEIVTVKKLKEPVKQNLKRRFNAHWNDEGFRTVPIKHKIAVDSFLKKAGIICPLEEIWEPFHGLSQSEQLAERLEQAKRIVTQDGLAALLYVTECIQDYNAIWNANIKYTDFEGKSIGDLKSLAISGEPKQIEHLNILFKGYCKVFENHEKVKHIGNNLKTIREKTNLKHTEDVVHKNQEDDDVEIDEISNNEELAKAKISARRMALIKRLTYDDIVGGICKPQP